MAMYGFVWLFMAMYGYVGYVRLYDAYTTYLPPKYFMSQDIIRSAYMKYQPSFSPKARAHCSHHGHFILAICVRDDVRVLKRARPSGRDPKTCCVLVAII